MDTSEDHSALRYSYLKQKCTENAGIGLGHVLCARQCVWGLSQCRKGPAEIEVLSTRGVWKSTLELVVISKNCLGAGAFHPWKKGDGIKTSPIQVDLNMAWSQEMKVIAEPIKWFHSFKCPPGLWQGLMWLPWNHCWCHGCLWKLVCGCSTCCSVPHPLLRILRKQLYHCALQSCSWHNQKS